VVDICCDRGIFGQPELNLGLRSLCAKAATDLVAIGTYSHAVAPRRVKGKLQVEASFRTALPSLTGFYARLLDDPPPYVCCLPALSMVHNYSCHVSR